MACWRGGGPGVLEGTGQGVRGGWPHRGGDGGAVPSSGDKSVFLCSVGFVGEVGFGERGGEDCEGGRSFILALCLVGVVVLLLILRSWGFAEDGAGAGEGPGGGRDAGGVVRPDSPGGGDVLVGWPQDIHLVY